MKFSWFNRRFLVTLLILVAVLFGMYFALRFRRALLVLERFTNAQHTLISDFSTLQEAYLDFGNDLNDIRSYLRMDANDYEPLEIDLPEDDTQSIQETLFSRLLAHQSQRDVERQNQIHFKAFQELTMDSFFSFLQKNSLTPTVETFEDSMILLIHDSLNHEVIKYYFNKNSGELIRKTPLMKESLVVTDLDEFADQQQRQLSRELKRLTVYFQTADILNLFFESDDGQNILANKSLVVVQDTAEYQLLNTDQERVATLTINPNYGSVTAYDVYLEDSTILSAKNLLSDLQDWLVAFSVFNSRQRTLQKKQDVFEATFVDPDYLKALDRLNYTIKRNEAESDFLEYDLMDETGALVERYRFDLGTGELEDSPEPEASASSKKKP
ncbi:hypothetical protein IPJ72_03365 [Candidatus Peregrinibacteria bacterium]|nr:MAG: hypothetical protein IPJ72_03365 [Candidatus Peregrinibacteria bacterium]